MQHPMPTVAEMTENILAVWRKTTARERINGRDWYENARDEMRHLSKVHGVSVDTVADVVALLSPSVVWERNLVEADNLLAGGSGPFIAYGANVNKAQRRLVGDMTTVQGPKVTAFAASLKGWTNQPVIDRHAITVALGFRPTGSAYTTPARYKQFGIAYTMAGREVGEFAQTVQAATWLHVRGGK